MTVLSNLKTLRTHTSYLMFFKGLQFIVKMICLAALAVDTLVCKITKKVLHTSCTLLLILKLCFSSILKKSPQWLLIKKKMSLYLVLILLYWIQRAATESD